MHAQPEHLIACAWCKRHMRWKHKEGDVPGDTSHGICPPCLADMVRKVKAMKQASDSDVA
jgi:hypothetical protein